MFIAGQIVSGVALVFNTSGRLFKKQSTNLIFNCIANILVAISFFLLGAYMGLVCMIVSAIRTFVFYLYAKNGWHKNFLLLILFTLLYLGTSFLIFTNWLEYIIIVAKGISYTYGAWQRRPQTFRILSIVSCLFTIWYNILYAGYINILCEILCIVFTSIVIVQHYNWRKRLQKVKAHTNTESEQIKE